MWIINSNILSVLHSLIHLMLKKASESFSYNLHCTDGETDVHKS